MRRREPCRPIDVAEAEPLIADGRTLVLDVRDRPSFDASHVDRARWICYSDLADIISGVEKTRPILVYCRRGVASLEYARALSDFGFLEVYSLVGGHDAWVARARARVAPARASLG